MPDDDLIAWDIEIIPDEDNLFMRVHRNWIEEGRLNPGVFKDIGDGMSVDWDKYSTPVETLARSRKKEDNYVIELNVGLTRNIPQEVIHTPDVVLKNRAHADVRGQKSPRERLKLMKIYKWIIPP